MNRKILLVGKNGQVGAELVHHLEPLGDLVALDRQQLDLLNPAEIRRAIQDTRPSLIINAAAYTAVDQAEKEPQIAQAINADAPALMAEEAKKLGALLIHYSTDYVFDGSKGTPYREDDSTNPINIYGKTKLAGEQAIREVGHPFFIFRTSWVYATRGRNFLLTILRLASEREELRVVDDQVGAPTRSRDIAWGTAEILRKFAGQDSLSSRSGTYHMTAQGQTSWYSFAKAILAEASRPGLSADWFLRATAGRPLLTRFVRPISTAEYPLPAKRPAYSVLSNLRIKEQFGFQLPDWRSQLSAAFAL